MGGIIEIIYQALTVGTVKIGGYLYGPFRPIYGFGCLLLYFIGRKFNKNLITIFFSSLIICSLFEYVSSFILELIFNRTWWIYNGFFLNINGRICLTISICWGILGVVFILYLEPFFKFLYNKINKKILIIILCILSVEYIPDGVFSVIKHLKAKF